MSTMREDAERTEKLAQFHKEHKSPGKFCPHCDHVIDADVEECEFCGELCLNEFDGLI